MTVAAAGYPGERRRARKRQVVSGNRDVVFHVAFTTLRSVEKQRARQADDRAFASGEKQAVQLNRQNSHFAGLGARIDYSLARRRY